jgi:hypothetical protein
VLSDSNTRVKIEVPDLARIGYAMHHSWGGLWSSSIRSHIRLCTAAGCTGAGPPAYTYEGPIITGVQPKVIPFKRGVTVRITGEHLSDAQSLLFFIPEVAIHQHAREYNATVMPGGSILDRLLGLSMNRMGWWVASNCQLV